jgi:hypothetical protein
VLRRKIAPGSRHDHVGVSRCTTCRSNLEWATGLLNRFGVPISGSRGRLMGEELSAPPEPG